MATPITVGAIGATGNTGQWLACFVDKFGTSTATHSMCGLRGVLYW